MTGEEKFKLMTEVSEALNKPLVSGDPFPIDSIRLYRVIKVLVDDWLQKTPRDSDRPAALPVSSHGDECYSPAEWGIGFFCFIVAVCYFIFITYMVWQSIRRW